MEPALGGYGAFGHDEKAGTPISLVGDLWLCAKGVLQTDCLPPEPWDYGVVLNFIKYRLHICNLFLNHFQDEMQDVVQNLGRILRLTPALLAYAECSQDAEIRAVLDYTSIHKVLPWSEYRRMYQYVQSYSNWSTFFVEYPDYRKEYLGEFISWGKGLCEYVMEMEDKGYTMDEIVAMKGLCRQVLSERSELWGSCSLGLQLRLCADGLMDAKRLSSQTQDFNEILNYVRNSIQLHNQALASRQQLSVEGFVKSLVRMLRLMPEVQSWAGNSREVDVRGVYDYGVMLRPRLWGKYRTVSNYMQMFKNWRAFFAGHSDCEVLYIVGYHMFLKDAYVFVEELERNGSLSDEAMECKRALVGGWRGLPLKIRLKRWVVYRSLF